MIISFKDIIGPLIVFLAVIFSVIPDMLGNDIFKNRTSKILLIVFGFIGFVLGLYQAIENNQESEKLNSENNERKELLVHLNDEIIKTRFNNDSLKNIILSLQNQLIKTQEDELNYRRKKEKEERNILIYQAILDLDCFYDGYLALDKATILELSKKRNTKIIPCKTTYLKQLLDINLRWFDRHDILLLIKSIEIAEINMNTIEKSIINENDVSLLNFLGNRDSIVELTNKLKNELTKYYIN